MEKKKENKSVSKKKIIKKKTETKENAKKTITKKNTINNKKKKTKAFTLIELLAVIIILGVLMIIAIPSVTTYISNSRKSSYVDTAKNIVGGARNAVNEGKLGMYDTNTTYYIPSSYIKTENGLKSPYGDFTEAYVGVVFDGTGYDYYWISTDSSEQGVKKVTHLNDLDEEDIVSGIKSLEIRETIETTGIGDRTVIKILQDNGTWNSPIILENTSNNIFENGSLGGNNNDSLIVYPTGKNKSSVVVGDIVKIGTEEFYVVKHDGNDLVLLAKYNLKVGKIINNWRISGEVQTSEEGYGMQNSEYSGYDGDGTYKGTVAFSNTNYWSGKVGNGLTYSGSYSFPNFPYVYDSNNNMKQYIDNYVSKLGVQIKEARLLKWSELIELGCQYSCENAPSFVYSTSYWLGNASSASAITIDYNGYIQDNLDGFDDNSTYGVRPVIVI